MSIATKKTSTILLLIPFLMIASGVILILSLIGKLFVPIPQAALVWMSAVGSVIGGISIIYTRIKNRTMRAIL